MQLFLTNRLNLSSNLKLQELIIELLQLDPPGSTLVKPPEKFENFRYIAAYYNEVPADNSMI